MKPAKTAAAIIASMIVIIGTTTLLNPPEAIALRQHSNLLNNCFRPGPCRESNVNIATVGNDNQITGFGDLSDNTTNDTSTANSSPQGSQGGTGAQGVPGTQGLKGDPGAAGAAGAAGAKGDTGPQGPSAPEPNRTSTLIVIKHVDNSAGGQTASDFTMHVSGNNALPSSFAGTDGPGATVKLAPGPYGVSEENPNPDRYTAIYSADCTGTINAGETKTCSVLNHLKGS